MPRRDGPRDPETAAEWQEAVDAAEWLIHVYSAKQYGLVTGGPGSIDVERCEEILKRGRARGIRPTAGVVELMTAAWNSRLESQRSGE